MKIRPKIPIYQFGGKNKWYKDIYEDYNPTAYESDYDPSLGLFAGDTSLGFKTAWSSPNLGYNTGRYIPTPGFGNLGKGREHYNYAENVEKDPYYMDFTNALLNNPKLRESFLVDVDKLLPETLRYHDAQGNLKNRFIVLGKDAQGRPFTKVEYDPLKRLEYLRGDQTIGANHNVYAKRGKRYFYVDDEGIKHFVDPNKIDNYQISEKPVNSGWDNNVYWDNYQLTGLKGTSELGNPEQERNPNKVRSTERVDVESPWEKLGQGFKSIAPDLLDAIRLGINLHNNERVFDKVKLSIRPNLLQTYNTHRQVVGDEATKQAYYRRAAEGQSRAAQPFTSDADRLTAYQYEAKRIGDELRAQGDLADNQEIRRTSDESNQHQWGNTQRATEIANRNIVEINNANAALRNLEALKYSADTSNWDNYLMGIQNKLELKRLKLESLLDTINTLQMLDALENDPDIKNAYQELETEARKLYPNGAVKWEDPRLSDYVNKYKSARRLAMIKYYKIYSAKSGAKLSYERDDKYLYKTARDIVEHFRKMSKMSDDSRLKSRTKPIKLSPHPKKMLQGGVAPFTIYRPLPVSGGVTGSTSSSGSSSKKEDKGKDKLDVIKDLFKAISDKALPVDVGQVYLRLSNVINRASVLGEELSTDDLSSMYLSSLQDIVNIKYSKEMHDKALAVATSNEALSEYAVDAAGNYIVQDKNLDGKIMAVKSLSEIKEKGLNPLTNLQLLYLRAYDPSLALRQGDWFVENIINNGMGINKIGAQIKALAGNLGSSDSKIEGLTLVESNKVKLGLLILANAPDGYYKHTNENKTQQAQVDAALRYISNMLSPALLAILNIHGGVKLNIMNFLNSQRDEELNVSFTPLTGKASEKSIEDSLDKLGINSATLLLLGMSSPREFTFNIGNGNAFTGAARVSSITKDGNPVGADFTYSEIYKSDLHKNLDLDNASFGNVPINKALKDRIIIDNSTIAGVDLPYTTDRNGRIIPDFLMLSRIEEADLEVLRAGIDPNKDPQKVNEIYAKHKLPIKYGADNKLTGNYKRFAVILATAIEDVFLNKDELASNGTLTLVSDENEINKYLGEVKKTTGEKEIDLDRSGWFTGKKDIYKGSIFIPIIGDLVDAVSATGGLKAGNYDELRSKYLTKNYNKAPLFVKQ